MSASADAAAFVAVDWGTSSFRAWRMAADGTPLAYSRGPEGMLHCASAGFAPVLQQHLEKLGASRDVPVLICGMAGARQGWIEAPYFETPADLHQLLSRAVAPPDAGDRYRVRILPGVCQRSAGAEDVMRGEETQLLGLLGMRPDFEGVVILPGTHSKWVDIRGGRIVRFSSAMTGELYEVLSQHSVLRHSFAGNVEGAEIETGIAEGMDAGLAHPELLSALIFRTRAAALLSGKGADWCSGYLSGLLVGAEIGGHRDWLTAKSVPLIGSARFARLYGAALARIGFEGVAIDAAEATIAGLKEARAQ